MNLKDLLRAWRVVTAPEGHRHTTKNRIQCECCFCSPHSGKFRLGVHVSGRWATCWSCGKRPIIQALSLLTGRPEEEVRESLRGMEAPHFNHLHHGGGSLKEPDFLGPLLPPHKKYLKGRGLDPEEMEEVWGLRGIGIAPRLSWRIWLPVSGEGKVLSWTTRGIGEREPRYVNAPEESEAVRLKSLLFGEDLAGPACAVVEGPFDAMRVGKGAVALLGAVFTRAQVLRISSFPLRVICLDGDETGRKQSELLCRELGALPGKTLKVELESFKDAAGASEEEIRELRRMIR